MVSAAYYLGVVRTMYFEAPPAEQNALQPASGYAVVVVGVATVLTVALGLVPASVLAATAKAFKVVLLG